MPNQCKWHPVLTAQLIYLILRLPWKLSLRLCQVILKNPSFLGGRSLPETRIKVSLHLMMMTDHGKDGMKQPLLRSQTMPCAPDNSTMEYPWKTLFLWVSVMKAPVNTVKDYDIPERLPEAPALNGTCERESVSKKKRICQLLAEE